MQKNTELDAIASSLLKYLMSDSSLKSKTSFEIYNEWAAASNIQIKYQENFIWALHFIQAEKKNPILRNETLRQFVEKETKRNEIN